MLMLEYHFTDEETDSYMGGQKEKYNETQNPKITGLQRVLMLKREKIELEPRCVQIKADSRVK